MFCRFVYVVRSVTPKITLYTPDATCLLMETEIDFEVTFLCGIKIFIWRQLSESDDRLKVTILDNANKVQSIYDFDHVKLVDASVPSCLNLERWEMLKNSLSVSV